MFYSILFVSLCLQMIQTQPLFDGGLSPEVDITMVMKLKEDMNELKRIMLQLKIQITSVEAECRQTNEIQNLQGRSNCENGWKTFDHSCYFFGNVRFNWTDAKNFCNNNMSGAYLVEIESSQENEFIIKEAVAIAPNYGYWIGGSDNETENEYIWVESKRPFNFTYWYSNQPDNHNNEDCVLISNKYGFRWNDAPCKGIGYAICEKPQS